MFCDNTSCPHNDSNDKLKTTRVEMLPEFEGGQFNWCDECVRRDGNMIKEIKEQV